MKKKEEEVIHFWKMEELLLEQLNEESIDLYGSSIGKGDLLKTYDPTAFRTAVLNYIDSRCKEGDLYESERNGQTVYLKKDERESEDSLYFLDNYEKHLLRYGPKKSFENTTMEERERDHKELKRIRNPKP